MDGFELATLDTLQHGLTRHPEGADGLAHWQEAFGGLGVEARLQLVGEADAPGRAGCELLARDDAVVEQAMDCRRRDAEGDRGALDGHEFAFGGVGLRDEAWDFPVGTQVCHAVALEAVTFCSST